MKNNMTVRAKPTGLEIIKYNNIHKDDSESESDHDLQIGQEFDTAEEAQEYYSSYATQIGFRIRIGQLYRSRIDGSVISRRFVCSKEGFQTNSRTGCPAYVRVQRVISGKWILVNIKKEHNHELELPGEINPPRIQIKPFPTPRTSITPSARTGLRSLDDEDPDLVPSGPTFNTKRLKTQNNQVNERLKTQNNQVNEPCKGLEFSSANEAYSFYQTYASTTGFKVRIGQLFRSKNDGSITSRRFVCSKEGHQHPSRVGCGAYMRIQRQESSKWIIDRYLKEHNHELEASSMEEASSGLENLDLIETNGGFSLIKRGRESNIENNWYSTLFEYFQTLQGEDTGFFYAVEMENGKAMNVFWADSRSRFNSTQFGDSIVFDTSYRRGNNYYPVPLVSFIGINHHKQTVLLGCALIAEDSEESFIWIFQAWNKAMSGKKPISIIADQDKHIQNAITQVFPGTHHRFSTWQIRVKEQENLSVLLSMSNEFKKEYETCITQSQTANEFDSSWNLLITKYNLQNNVWLNEMYRNRKSWVPLYIKGTFFAGISLDGIIKPYFGTFLTGLTPLNEFILRYEKAIEQKRDEERKEDFNSCNLVPVLHTKDPIEEQCKRIYTLTMFKVFQKELLECYSYVGLKINVEGAISRYLVQKCDERNTVAFNASNLNINCSCKMFEFEGVLCRHGLKVYQIMNVKEIPSRYILHRWSKNAKYGILRDVESGNGCEDLKSLMLWSLREEARNYIEAGVTSLERYKLAFEIMQEGRRNLSWQN